MRPRIVSTENNPRQFNDNARHSSERRAFSLLELMAVLTILGLVAGMAALRYSDSTLGVTQGQGFARKIARGLDLARRHAIASGGSAALRFQRTSGAITSFDIVRVNGSDQLVETSFEVPRSITVTSSNDRWEFAFDGKVSVPSLDSSITISNGSDTWTITVFVLSGTYLLSGT